MKLKTFVRWARSEGLSDEVLCVAAREIEAGLVNARLGGFLIKKRIAKGGRGKSGGLRTIIAHRQGKRLIFLFGFAKRQRGDIEDDEKKALHKLADVYMAKSDKELDDLVKQKILFEVRCDGEAEEEQDSH
jgi:hypothetical protein